MTCAVMGLGPGSWRGHIVHPGSWHGPKCTPRLVSDACRRPRGVPNFGVSSWPCGGELPSCITLAPDLPSQSVACTLWAQPGPAPCSLAAAGWESTHVSLGFVLGSPPVCGRTCFTPPSVLLRWSRVTEGSSVVFSEPLDFPACLGLMSLVHRGLLFRLFKHSHVNCDSFGRSLFSVSVTNAGSPFSL